MGWIDSLIKSRVEVAVDGYTNSESFREAVRSAVHEHLRKPEYAFFVFVQQIQAELMRVDKTLRPFEALKIAKNVYNEFLHDENCKFGDPRYCWDKDGAVDLAHAFEIDHWESAP